VGVPGLNGWTFTPDGEGRPYSTTYGTSTDWVTKMSYYPTNASNPPNTTVTFGNGDTDVYGFDATTGRMNSFEFSVGSTPTTLTGTPGWNKNGTLGMLAITDQFNSGNTQNCSYVYDDLARIQSVSCTNGSTSVFNQTFTLDPFGNVSKSGSSTFAATYVLSNGTTNNQEQTVGSCTPTYDANGDMTKDCSFASPPNYVWDSDGNATTVRNGITLTYDALDREVEFATSSAHVQILYTPIGKLGTMSGQSVKAIRIPLPGGSTVALYGAGGASIDILHSDWLGSSRLATAYGARDMVYDTGYAPYGENYASAGSATANLDFTGQFQDTMSGLDDFLNREYDPVQGRWISPDPSGLNAADPSNPQSWNRYAYVLNNPLANYDPDGLDCVFVGDSGQDVESIDHQSSASECWGNGGYWADGYVYNNDSVHIDSQSDTLTIGSWLWGNYGITTATSDTSIGGPYTIGFDEMWGARIGDFVSNSWIGRMWSSFTFRELAWESRHPDLMNGIACASAPDANNDIHALAQSQRASVGTPSAPSDTSTGGGSGLNSFGAARQNMIWLNNSNATNNGGQSLSVPPTGVVSASAGAAVLDYGNSTATCMNNQ
jgi:RHS repeat-associated protein